MMPFMAAISPTGQGNARLAGCRMARAKNRDSNAAKQPVKAGNISVAALPSDLITAPEIGYLRPLHASPIR
jgi:hypothetical protein